MIAFDKILLENTFLVAEAKQLKIAGFIQNDQYKLISNNLPKLKSIDNILIRLAMFLLGSFFYSSICGVFSLFFMTIGDDNLWSFLILFYALFGVGIQDNFSARYNHYFGYGLDDAFILVATLLFGFGFFQLFNSNVIVTTILISIIAAVFYFRYLHLPSALISFITALVSLFCLLLDYCIYGKELLPFVMLLFAVFVFAFLQKKERKTKVPYYNNGFKLIKFCSLILLYLATNYLVVRELSAILSDKKILISPEIPMNWIFYIFTICTPIIYLYAAFKQKDRFLLWAGIITFCFTVYTIRYYHHIMPSEIALTISGVLLFVLAVLAIRKLKNKENGITFKSDRFTYSNSFQKLQTIASTSIFGFDKETSRTNSPIQFGGGDFSGGGAGASF